MTQQYPGPQYNNGPQNPGQPQWAGQPQQPWGQPPMPQQPKKNKAGKIVGFGCLGVVALFVIIGIAAAASGGNDNKANDADKAPAQSQEADNSSKEKPKEDKPAKEATGSQADQFKACVAKNGTPTEKSAVKHVVKVTGADKQNNILDSAEIYTDYTGGFMSSNTGDAKLIASAFGSCYKSDNGLVSVYGSDGDIISTGNF